MAGRTCDYCGGPLPADARRNRRFCSRAHKREALRQRRKREETHERLVTRSPLYADASLAELHERARPRLVQVDDESPEVVPDEFGYTDGVLDDDQDNTNPSWTVRQQIEAETNAIRARYAPEIDKWTEIYRRNPGPAPRLTEINRRMNAEIEATERAYYQAEAYELAAADQASGRAHIRAQERHKAIVNLEGFGRDIRGARYEPVQVAKATSDVFQFGEPASVFGSDGELFRKSGIAQRMYQSQAPVDGFVY